MGPTTPESWLVKAIPLGAVLVFGVIAVLLIPCTRKEEEEEGPSVINAIVPPVRNSARITRFEQMQGSHHGINLAPQSANSD
jgi:hypothetical protein